jgi:hypothetical protein
MSRSGGVVVVSESVRASGLEVASTWPFRFGEHLALMMRVCSRREKTDVVSCRSIEVQAEHRLLAAHSRIDMVHMLGLWREDDNSDLEERDGVVVHLRDCFVAAVSCRRDRLVDPVFVVGVGRSCRPIHCRSHDHVDVLRPYCFCCCCLRDRLYVDACVVSRVLCRILYQSACRQPCQSLLFQVPFQPDSVRAIGSQRYVQSSGLETRSCGGKWKGQ